MTLSMVHEAVLELAVMGTGLHVEDKAPAREWDTLSSTSSLWPQIILSRMEPSFRDGEGLTALGKENGAGLGHLVGGVIFLWESLSSVGDRKTVTAWRRDLEGLV